MRIVNMFWVLVAMAVLCAPAAAIAEPVMPPVAKKSMCTACHKVDGKLVGPAFSWIAYKYKDDKKKGKQAIIDQIVNGGSRQWIRYTGGAMMPPLKDQTTEAERNELADFILSLEPVAPPEY